MGRKLYIILFIFISLAISRQAMSANPSQLWLNAFAPYIGYSPYYGGYYGYYAPPAYGYYAPYYGSYSYYPNTLMGGTRSSDYYVNRAQMKATTPVVMTPKQWAVYSAKPVQKVLW